MIRSPLGLRLDPSRSIRDQLYEAARLGAKGVVADATADLAPDQLSETGRREVRHLLRSIQLEPIALHLPTRRGFDTEDQLDDRLNRAERAFNLAYELGSRLVLARVGGVPAESESESSRRETFLHALRELGRRADRQGVRLTVETGTEPGATLRAVLETLDSPGLAASLDPASLLRNGHDPAEAAVALGPWVAHAYANDATTSPRAARVAHPGGVGFPPGALDWEQYLGSLEEINYRGYLTVWPEPGLDPGAQFAAVVRRLESF